MLPGVVVGNAVELIKDAIALNGWNFDAGVADIDF